MIKFDRKNTVAVYSKYRSIYGYTLFYVVDVEYNLISPLLQSSSAPLNIYESYKQNELKNFKEVKRLHRNASETYQLLDKQEFDRFIYERFNN